MSDSSLDGQPFVIPTAYARAGEQIYIHGSSASRLMRLGAARKSTCA